jgi:hypothetical protein
MSPLNVICYSDGRPGHEKQSRAVLIALGRLTPLSIATRTLGETAGLKRLVQGLHRLTGIVKDVEASALPTVDLIIGTGSTTHLPMVGLKLRSGARVVTCMTPDPWLKPWFDLCFVPRHDKPPSGSKYFPTFGPPCLPLRSDRHNLKKGLVLAGGVDARSHLWHTADFVAQVEMLLSKGPDMSWTLASSGRTPSDAVDALRDLAADRNNVEFYSADETPQGWIESAYEAHGQVWVTADSVSMIYEALTAGCRVGVLPVAWRRSDNKFRNGIDDLKRRDLIVDFDRWIQGAASAHIAQSFDEAARCANEILLRWWPERLGRRHVSSL